MTHTSNAFGITVSCWIPLLWRPLVPVSRTADRELAADRANERHLKSLCENEVRDPVPPELATIEALTIDVLRCVKQVPPARTVTLGGDSVEWIEDGARAGINKGDGGLLQLFLDPELPQEVEFFAEIQDVVKAGNELRVMAKFVGRSDRVIELYQQLVFIYHRRARRSTSGFAPSQRSGPAGSTIVVD